MDETLLVPILDKTTLQTKMWKVKKSTYDKIVNQVKESGVTAEWDESIEISINKNNEVKVLGKTKR